MVCRPGGNYVELFFFFFLKGARHVGKIGQGWGFLLAFEEVQDEGLGTASS